MTDACHPECSCRRNKAAIAGEAITGRSLRCLAQPGPVIKTQLPLLDSFHIISDLSEELECPVCLAIYTDPVTLRCGHNFCRVCIDRVLDSQEGSAGYSCPECREKYKERPGLQTNIALRNIAERFLPTQPDQEASGVRCTYCVDSPVPAVMSCLHCDASLCDKHLRVHSKAPEHVLCAPTTSPETRKCSVHKKILEYYCTEDAACVCVSCYVIGGHVGHKMMSLDEAFKEKKKKQLRNDLQKLMAETEEAKKRVQSLEERRRKAQENENADIETVEPQQMSQSYDDVIRQLEIKKEELSRKMRHIEELCNITDPLTLLQESHTGDLCDTEDRHDKQLHDGEDLDVMSIQSFSSGQHYWEVDVGGSERWRAGMCYSSIHRNGLGRSMFGYSSNSWCLCRLDDQCSVRHDSKVIRLPDGIPSDRVRIYLYYEAGKISFYALCDPIKHLHTFTATFTEPLHAALWIGVVGGYIKISGGNQEM
ncbi:E3 ubiquitin/ISG15 ligase TRIM25-like [Hyperolius riggenbachi]|uniref:E3 ubiquitin/ISG15 ligase TRIM25-like n=1 Tax=Hyperolius riggenbachi TaxID=752182 RepID=UPI0035A3148C